MHKNRTFLRTPSTWLLSNKGSEKNEPPLGHNLVGNFCSILRPKPQLFHTISSFSRPGRGRKPQPKWLQFHGGCYSSVFQVQCQTWGGGAGAKDGKRRGFKIKRKTKAMCHLGTWKSKKNIVKRQKTKAYALKSQPKPKTGTVITILYLEGIFFVVFCFFKSYALWNSNIVLTASLSESFWSQWN